MVLPVPVHLLRHNLPAEVEVRPSHCQLVSSIIIDLYTFALVNGYLHHAVIGNAGVNVFDPKNFNRSAIRALSEFINGFK